MREQGLQEAMFGFFTKALVLRFLVGCEDGLLSRNLCCHHVPSIPYLGSSFFSRAKICAPEVVTAGSSSFSWRSKTLIRLSVRCSKTVFDTNEKDCCFIERGKH